MKNFGIILAIGSLFVWGFGQSQIMINQYVDAIKQFTYGIKGISKVKISKGLVKFNLDLLLNNPSDKNFNFNLGNTITLKQIQFYNTQGNYIGVAKPNLSSIILPANSSTVIKDIPAELPLQSISNLISLATNFATLSQNLEIKATIKVASKTFEI